MDVPSPDLNQSGVQFVLTDLAVALTLLDVAATSTVPDTMTRNYENARHAYYTVLRHLQHLTPDTQQQKEIDRRLLLVKQGLQAAGIVIA